MDRFVKAVNNMDATVLVPSKLRDMDVNSPGGSHLKRIHRRVPPALANTPDLYSFYLMLNEVKKELLWGPGTGAVAAATMGSSLLAFSGRSSPRDTTSCIHSSSSIASSVLTHSSGHSSSAASHSLNSHSTSNQSNSSNCSTKQHSRQPSDDSLGSLGSSTVSSSEQDTDSEVDSLLTDSRDSGRDTVDEHTSHMAAAFRHHLQGLHTILHQLADSADYLSSRYQEEIDASSL